MCVYIYIYIHDAVANGKPAPPTAPSRPSKILHAISHMLSLSLSLYIYIYIY